MTDEEYYLAAPNTELEDVQASQLGRLKVYVNGINLNLPVCYVSNNKPKVGAFILAENCSSLEGNFYIKGIASNGMVFKPKRAIIQGLYFEI